MQINVYQGGTATHLLDSQIPEHRHSQILVNSGMEQKEFLFVDVRNTKLCSNFGKWAASLGQGREWG